MRIAHKPIFVVGAPRSGTSMMQWALRQHPHLWGGQESDWLMPFIDHLRQDHEFGSRREKLHWLSGQGVDWNEFIRTIGLGVNALYTSRSGGNRWVEQTPLYTLLLGDIADMFPDAQFLFMLRDGRQVAHSLRNFVNPMEMEQAAQTWRAYVKAGLDFAASSRGDRLHTVRYSDIVADTERVVGEIYDFLDEPFEQASVEFIRKGKPINSSFSGESSGDKVSERWLEWSVDDRRLFNEIAGDTLARAGFAATADWVGG